MSSTSAENSLLLWALGALLYWLGAHVMLAALRDARREPGFIDNWFNLVLAGLAIGSVLCAGMVVALTGNTMAFSLGFSTLAGAGLLGGALLGGVVVALVIGVRPGWAASLIGGLLLGALAVAVQAGWLASGGLRPGIVWRPDAVAMAAGAAVLGAVLALFLAFSDGAMFSRARLRWRVAAAGVLAVALVGAQELLIAGARLGAQVGSVFQNQLPASMLALVFGSVVPLLLVVAALDLSSGRNKKRGAGGDDNVSAFAAYPPSSPNSRRRRRRTRIRNL
jgi:NO-binding membrane sensor protein with MHYT domain